MAGTWTALANQPSFNAGTMLLLTDGSVLCQDSGTKHWWKLTPNYNGNYAYGTWSQLADGPNAPLYYASAVLRDGRVFMAGGEYNAGNPVELNAAEIYDPWSDTWTSISTPTGWANIGDAPSVVFPDGRVMIGSINDTRCAIYDPVANTWTAAANKGSRSAEETWTLLPDGTVLTVDCTAHPKTEKYVIAADSWVSAGSTPADLVEASSIEIGPAVLQPDGRVVAIGATGKTAVYTMPPVANQPGVWTQGPQFPNVDNQTLAAKDTPACLLPSGKVLCAAGPVDGKSGDYLGPTYFFEYDSGGNLTRVSDPANGTGPPYLSRMLLLPTGQVLLSASTKVLCLYTPDGAPDNAWRPQITTVSADFDSQGNTVLRPGGGGRLCGLQINGLSQAVSYGDDAQMATNYPIVRLLYGVPTEQTVYLHTGRFSTLGVQTGTLIEQCFFGVPNNVPMGYARIQVVANGIASSTYPVVVSDKNQKETKPEVKENKEKDHEDGHPQLETGDPAWLQAVRTIAQRTDEIAAEMQRRSFIREGERPELGGLAIEESDQGERASGSGTPRTSAGTPGGQHGPGSGFPPSSGKRKRRG